MLEMHIHKNQTSVAQRPFHACLWCEMPEMWPLEILETKGCKMPPQINKDTMNLLCHAALAMARCKVKIDTGAFPQTEPVVEPGFFVSFQHNKMVEKLWIPLNAVLDSMK